MAQETLEYTVVADHPLRVGENPLWDEQAEMLYYVGVYEGRIYRHDPSDASTEVLHSFDQQIGAVTLTADGSLLCFTDRGTVRRWREGAGIVETLVEPGSVTEARFNDVVTDPEGRVFCGTKGVDDAPGTLYRLDTDASLIPLVNGIQLSNGLGFSPDLETLYYAESRDWRIHAFDYDQSTGELSNRRTFAAFDHDGGFPDGLTVDADGDVWTALAYGGQLARLAPDGSEVARYETPGSFPTSVAFGGPDLRDLYVTTGGGDDRAEFGEHAGATLRCRPGVTGRAPFRARISA
ncbi:MAG: SMP-30/gluconolactonase/LRE family protein [Salinirussus sp.]